MLLVLSFWPSIVVLSLAQGALVAAPRAWACRRLQRLRGRRWALVPPASIVGFVLIAGLAEHASADGLTYLALVAVPLLAALALGWLIWTGSSPRARHAPWALLVVPLFALAWVDRSGLAGQAAAVALSGLSCVTLGVLLANVTPPRWLAGGIVAMAIADSALVIAELLQAPNSALNAAHPAAGLPILQSASFGSAVMGYGDLFVAGVFGGLLALQGGRSMQLAGAALVAVIALIFDLLFLVLKELPATVPVALALLLLSGLRARARSCGAAADPHPRGVTAGSGGS